MPNKKDYHFPTIIIVLLIFVPLADMKITYKGIDHPLKNSQDKTSLNKKHPASVSKQLSTTIRPKTTFNMTSNYASNLDSNSLGQNPDFGLTTS